VISSVIPITARILDMFLLVLHKRKATTKDYDEHKLIVSKD